MGSPLGAVSCGDSFPVPELADRLVEIFGTGKLQIIALRSRGRLKGILPVSVIEEAESHSRIAVLNGTGISDYLDVLIEP